MKKHLKKETRPFIIFWTIGVSVIMGRLVYDLNTYFHGSVLVYRNVSGHTYDYLIHLPRGYTDFGRTRPLIVFLHGAGETGKDVCTLKDRSVAYYANQNIKKNNFPFIVVSPVAFNYDWKPQRVIRLLDEILEDHTKRWRIDETQIYLTGFSMGGYGAWKTAAHYPNRFAAIVSVASGCEPEIAPQLHDVPAWAFHGDSDEVVGIEWSEMIINAMKELDSIDARLTVFPGAGHGIVSEVYSDPAVFRWMLLYKKEQRRTQCLSSSL